ncbi:hypothetical protein [Parasitella parasitica]|uniref:Uncharacterized protein n=1 Tax=Parasitella parasitica TaxID=35722 RepID=A0A0B7MY16_9FUNG|nr:hypothetical protein [Parasitella parasitica]
MTFPTAIRFQKTIQQDTLLLQKVIQQIRPELIKAATASAPKAAAATPTRWGDIEKKKIATDTNPAVVFDSLLQTSASVASKERNNRFEDAIL